MNPELDKAIKRLKAETKEWENSGAFGRYNAMASVVFTQRELIELLVEEIMQLKQNNEQDLLKLRERLQVAEAKASEAMSDVYDLRQKTGWPRG